MIDALVLYLLIRPLPRACRGSNCNEAGNCLNMSVCAFTSGSSLNSFSVVAYNPLAQATTQLLRVPVTGDAWNVTANGKAIARYRTSVARINDFTPPTSRFTLSVKSLPWTSARCHCRFCTSTLMVWRANFASPHCHMHALKHLLHYDRYLRRHERGPKGS